MTSSRNDQCHLCYSRKNWILSVQSNVCGSATCRGLQFGAKMDIQPVLGFSDEDKIGIIQPHDDALVVTLRIGGYDVKRVLVDQGSAVEIMYPDFYKGLNLKPKDLTAYDSPLVSFEGKKIIPKGQIRLPI